MKCTTFKRMQYEVEVAPLVGAWIEILIHTKRKRKCGVAPLVGAWIEIPEIENSQQRWNVAPLVGAWIEIWKLRSKILAAWSLLL